MEDHRCTPRVGKCNWWKGRNVVWINYLQWQKSKNKRRRIQGHLRMRLLPCLNLSQTRIAHRCRRKRNRVRVLRYSIGSPRSFGPIPYPLYPRPSCWVHKLWKRKIHFCIEIVCRLSSFCVLCYASLDKYTTASRCMKTRWKNSARLVMSASANIFKPVTSFKLHLKTGKVNSCRWPYSFCLPFH